MYNISMRSLILRVAPNSWSALWLTFCKYISCHFSETSQILYLCGGQMLNMALFVPRYTNTSTPLVILRYFQDMRKNITEERGEDATTIPMQEYLVIPFPPYQKHFLACLSKKKCHLRTAWIFSVPNKYHSLHVELKSKCLHLRRDYGGWHTNTQNWTNDAVLTFKLKLMIRSDKVGHDAKAIRN